MRARCPVPCARRSVPPPSRHRRLCILKGIYPRDPKKKTKGKNQTYYHYKDIQYLHHEPLLAKFRETKVGGCDLLWLCLASHPRALAPSSPSPLPQAFIKKVKKAVGRNEVDDARRMYASRPEYTLDHLVKERYPRFGDALADLDDPICLVHLYASLPSDKYIDPKHTSLARRLSQEWQAYVVKTRALRKVPSPSPSSPLVPPSLMFGLSSLACVCVCV